MCIARLPFCSSWYQYCELKREEVVEKRCQIHELALELVNPEPLCSRLCATDMFLLWCAFALCLKLKPHIYAYMSVLNLNIQALRNAQTLSTFQLHLRRSLVMTRCSVLTPSFWSSPCVSTVRLYHTNNKLLLLRLTR